MTKKFLAITTPGTEFIFRMSSAIAVPERSAGKILELLNKIEYKLKPGEVWHVYENDFYYNDRIENEIKRYSKNSMKVYRYHG